MHRAYLKFIQTTRIEPAMNDISTTAKRIFNALAFANVSNLGEFHSLLRQIDAPNTAREPEQTRTITQPPGNTPVLGHIQGAV
jgi:hypothetical protein